YHTDHMGQPQQRDTDRRGRAGGGGVHWALRLLFTAVHAMALAWSASRTSMATAMVPILIAFAFYGSRRLLMGGLIFVMAVSVVLLVLDPGLEWGGAVLGSGEDIVRRGQSNRELSQMSGRAEMWAAIYDEFTDAPVMGHGYFVSSARGKLYVWNIWANHTAHHLFLQVMVSTGLVGLVFFCWQLIAAASSTMGLIRSGQSFQRRVGVLACFIALWFLIWGQTCNTFLGPLRPECLAFFSLFGILMGVSATNDHCSADHDDTSSNPVEVVR
ncbi:MAG: O-antigen ligase family protein, partial [Planctomycetota bacterium]